MHHSIQPIRIEAIDAVGQDPYWQTLLTKDDAQSLPEISKAAVGNTIGVQQTDDALRELGQAMEQFNVSIKFSKDAETGKIVIEMIDQKSGETLLQIPNVASLHVAATLSKLQGKIFNVKA